MKNIFKAFLSIITVIILLNCSESGSEKAQEVQADSTSKKDTLLYKATEADKLRLEKLYEEMIKYWTSDEWMNEFETMANKMFVEGNKMLDKEENPNPKIQELGKAFEEKIWMKYVDILRSCGFQNEEEKLMIEESLKNDSTIIEMQKKAEMMTKEFYEKLMKKVEPMKSAFLKRAEEIMAKRKLQQKQ